LIFTVGLNRLSVDKKSIYNGTGGFDYYIKTTVPVSKTTLKNIEINKIFFRLYESGTADCFNLNRVINPSILGIDDTKFNDLKYFSFTDEKIDWNILNEKYKDESIIPAVADASSIKWIMKKSLGDYLYYYGTGGKLWKVKLVAALKNSVFQGNIIISEKSFIKMFPELNGNRVLLLKKILKKEETELEELFEYGASVELATDRIQKFNSLQNTYLMIFFQLGLLSLILGLAGIIIIILRNIHERKIENELMSKIGFSKIQIFKLYFYENFMITFYSAILGLIAHLVAKI
jgi:ABC-type antimicrobial peptide transport system permease subunit